MRGHHSSLTVKYHHGVDVLDLQNLFELSLISKVWDTIYVGHGKHGSVANLGLSSSCKLWGKSPCIRAASVSGGPQTSVC